jgi:hypothetical protein
MLHWATSFAWVALAAAIVALTGLSFGLRPIAILIFLLCAALSLLSLLTAVFGRGRDGLYAPERAIMVTSFALVLAFAGYSYVRKEWTIGDAERVVTQQVARLGEIVDAVRQDVSNDRAA